MATISITVVGSTIGTIPYVSEIADSDESDKFLAYLRDMHGTDDDGNPRTAEQMVELYWQGIVNGTVANIERWEREKASQAAAAAVTPITITTQPG